MSDMRLGGIHRQNEDSPHVPVYNLLMRAWRVTVGGQHEFLVRYPSLLLGLLLLSLMYRAGRDLGLSLPGVFAAVLLVGLNPQITLHLREARPYAPMLPSAAFAAVMALRFERLRAAVWIAAASLLALLTHYFNVPFIGALGLWGALRLKGRMRRNWIISQGIAWAFFAVWLPLMGRAFFNPTSLNTGKTWSFILPPWETLARLAMVGALGYREYATTWLAYVGGVLLLGGWLVGSLHGRGQPRRFLLLMVALPLIFYALLGWVRPVFHPKFMLPWLLFASLGIGQLMTRRPWAGGAVGAGLCALMVIPTLRTVQQPYDPGVVSTADLSTGPREMTRELLRLAGPNDAFGMGTPDPVHCYYTQHYFDRSLDCALMPKSPTQTVGDLENQVSALLEKRDVLWYLDYYNPVWDPQQIAAVAFSQRALGLGEEEIAGRKLRLFTGPGTVVRPSVNAKVFVHLADENGGVISQDDGIPVSWSRPLETWDLGEQLLDVHVLSLPPDTNFDGVALQVGLYDASTLERLSAYTPLGQRLADDAASAPLAPWVHSAPAVSTDP
ncbi:MAG: glycosyltransferase family 39 protein [Chloroflexi bacterium]|nr:glycosyltransferase family 39 protein [Chloroflexota bacterium]